jgi:peptidoglycan hydrolase CwlO-like protein
MVDRVFYITGDNESTFSMSLLTSILGKAKLFHVKTDTLHIEQGKRIRVVASGTLEGVAAFHKYVKENDVCIKPIGATYHVSDLEVYKGPKIDWNYIGLSSISEQMEKGFDLVITGLQKIDQDILTLNSEISSIKDKFEIVDQKFENICTTIKNIDNKIKEPWPDS